MRALFLLCLLALSASASTPRRACVATGDSITYGYSFDATPYPARLATLLGRPVANFGVGFDRMASIRSRWQALAKPFPYKTLIIEGGTNDLALDSTAASTLWPYVQAFIEEAQAAGQQVVLVLIPPRWGSSGWDSTKETERLAYNQDARDYASTHPALLIVDSDVVLGDGATPPALQSAFDYGDKLHLSGGGAGSGMQALAAAVAVHLQ